MFRFALGSKVPLFLVLIFLLTLNAAGLSLDKRQSSRTSPPKGAVIVRQADPAAGEFASIQEAVDSLPWDNSTQEIFIYAGVYPEQVNITRPGPTTMYGYTTDTTTYTSNSVVITHSESLGAAGTDAKTGTLIVQKSDFNLYNVNISNTFGMSTNNGQALAVSALGTRQAYYAVAFSSYQDTVYAYTGKQFYGGCYIEGAVDFIFGRKGIAFFQKNVIASSGPGCITADGADNSTVGIFVINESRIVLASDASPKTFGRTYLGRPWSDHARVVFSNSYLGSHVNNTGWSEWSPAKPNTDNILFGEYCNTGPGALGKRAPFATELTSDDGYKIAEVLGSDYATWVDTNYT